MPRRFPEPDYVIESVSGGVYDLPGGLILYVGDMPPESEPLLSAFTPRLSGTLVVRYGISFNSPAADALIPGMFVSEKGVAITGREAWNFMLQRYQLYPRADIIGQRLTGAAAQVFLRELDWGRSPRAIVYPALDVWYPAFEPLGVFCGSDISSLPELPPLLATYLPAIENLAVLVTPPEG